MSESILNRFEKLLAIPAPSGREESLAESVKTDVAQMGYDPQVDGAKVVAH